MQVQKNMKKQEKNENIKKFEKLRLVSGFPMTTKVLVCNEAMTVKKEKQCKWEKRNKKK